jgi:single-strand DNA-binding protein
MSSVNKVILVGHVGKEPTFRNTQRGDKVASFSMATSKRWRDRDGEKMESTCWHNIVSFQRSVIEAIEGSVRKGTKVYVEGEIATRKYPDPGGGKDRYITEIIAAKVENVDEMNSQIEDMPGGDRTAPDRNSYGNTRPAGQRREQPRDDEVPF